MTDARGVASVGLLAALFVIGFVLMGFEMLGSRYLNPYFGGGITTWACLISVVLFAMMVGYFAGGYAVDAYPGVELFAGCVVAAAASILVVPPTADAVLQFLIRTLGDGFWGVLIASMALSFVPVAFLSACSPFVVRLLLVDLEAGGKTAGLVYSVSTLGNVAGTLATTFYLIPNFGTRAITTAFGIALVAVAVALYLSKRGLSRGLNTRAAAGLALCLCLVATSASAAEPERASWEASYPEGPIWVGERLLYAEMPLNRVMEWKDGKLRAFWSEPGCGPTAIAQFRGSEFIVLCHFQGKLAHLDKEGRKIGTFTASSAGERLRNPNDCHIDGQGGVFFTDPGIFAKGSPATGKVYHLLADGKMVKLVDGMHYSNGIAVDFPKRRLLVSEHLARKVWQFRLGADLSISDRKVFLDVDRYLDEAEITYAETGPDGIEVDSEGNTFIPIYGSGRMMVVAAGGTVSKLQVATKFVTNIAISDTRAVVVGSFINDRPPFAGRVELMPRATLMDLVKRSVVSPLR